MMSQHSKIARLIIVFLILITSLILSTCSSSTLLRSEDLADTEDSRAIIVMNVKKGDTVKLVTTEGKTLKFKVLAIDSEAITSKDRRIPFEEISRLEKVEVDAATTLVTAAGAVTMIAAAAGVIGFLLIINLLNDL